MARPQLGRVRMARDGQPMFPNEQLVAPGPDGYRVVELSGPAQVATPAYRDGWDRTFAQTLN